MNEQKRKNSGLGVGVALILWGVCFVVFPKFTGLVVWLTWVFYIVGFILVLIGIAGTCIELFKDDDAHVWRRNHE
jgi:uncharacterized membrane protein HdeD (DUF308 family)